MALSGKGTEMRGAVKGKVGSVDSYVPWGQVGRFLDQKFSSFLIGIADMEITQWNAKHLIECYMLY